MDGVKKLGGGQQLQQAKPSDAEKKNKTPPASSSSNIQQQGVSSVRGSGLKRQDTPRPTKSVKPTGATYVTPAHKSAAAAKKALNTTKSPTDKILEKK